MSEEEASDELPEVQEALAERLRLRLPALQAAFQAKTGEQISISDLQEVLAPELADVAQQVTRVTVSHDRLHSGPLPSPQSMREYAEIYPEGPKQFFDQLKDEQSHRHRWEMTHLTGAIADRRRKDHSMLFTALGGLAIAALLAALGAHAAAATVAIFVVLGGGALALGRRFLATQGKDGVQVELGRDDDQPNADRSER